MEKRKPHYPRARIKALIREGGYRVTRTAMRCATNDFGFSEAAEIAEAILSLDNSDFFKSMTMLRDSAIWQDVYRPDVGRIPAYVKVQIVDLMTVVISFKSLEDD